MKILQINSVYKRGSTGRIAYDLHESIKHAGHESRVVYGYGSPSEEDAYCMQNIPYLKYSIMRGRITGHHGFYNKRATKKALKWIKNYNPDVVHLHNIHGYYINIEMLMEYLREYRKPIVWTFHDCWPFTGHCTYFDQVQCERWKRECGDCPGWNEYKIIGPDRSKKNLAEKKKIFSGFAHVQIVTPSQWLADLVKESYLGCYPVEVVHNGIEIKKFHSMISEVKESLGIKNRIMVLGIAPDLDGGKGGRDMLRIAEELGPDYVMVILSLKTREKLPDNVQVLPRTNSVEELAKIYSAADVFINPTMQDNYPTVNLEAYACGTPTITYDTGGSPEGVFANAGEVVPKGDWQAMAQAIKRWANKKSYETIHTNGELVGKSKFAEAYLDIYKKLV